MHPILLSLPDDLADWRGTAAELADKLNDVLAGIPSLADDAGSANERLVRHYVQVGVLTAPEREGREALFGLRQVVEFLAARYLIKDGWPLAKVAEMVRATDLDGLAGDDPHRAAAHPRRGSGREVPAPASDSAARVAYSRELTHGGRSSQRRRRLQPHAREPPRSPPAAQPCSRPCGSRPRSRAPPASRVAACRSRRTSRRSATPTGRADRSRIVRIELTPWCHVHVDAATLGEMSEDTPEILGAALTQALQEERIQKGK